MDCSNLHSLTHFSFGRFLLEQFLHGEEIMFPPFIECYSKNTQDNFRFIINKLQSLLSIEGKVYFDRGKSHGSGSYPEYYGEKVNGSVFPEIHVDQAKLCGISNQLDGAVKAELVHNIGAVVLNRLGADEKLFSNRFT